jgi:hypothetical protein
MTKRKTSGDERVFAIDVRCSQVMTGRIRREGHVIGTECSRGRRMGQQGQCQNGGGCRWTLGRRKRKTRRRAKMWRGF